jgi:hypothetical protein
MICKQCQTSNLLQDPAAVDSGSLNIANIYAMFQKGGLWSSKTAVQLSLKFRKELLGGHDIHSFNHFIGLIFQDENQRTICSFFSIWLFLVTVSEMALRMTSSTYCYALHHHSSHNTEPVYSLETRTYALYQSSDQNEVVQKSPKIWEWGTSPHIWQVHSLLPHDSLSIPFTLHTLRSRRYFAHLF